MLYSQIDREPLNGKDQLGFSIGRTEDFQGSPPAGLAFRTKESLQNLIVFAMDEARKVGYEMEIVSDDGNWGEAVQRLQLEKALERLDAGNANALFAYTEMLPANLKRDGGMPSAELLARAESHGWRIILINLFVDPDVPCLFWEPTFLHLVKEEVSRGVVVGIHGYKSSEEALSIVAKYRTN